MRHRLALILLVVCAALPAMQLQECTFYSPITGRKFVALATPVSQHVADNSGGLADMGVDDDGCRHSSNLSEYDHYVVTDPFSYFSALAVEWDDKSGRFHGEITADFKKWVEKEFNSEYKLDWNHAWTAAGQAARAQGRPQPDREQFVMSQEQIPIEKRYQYALRSYEKRGARPSVIAKLALTGAWALRCRMQLPVSDPRLAGGFEEVNDKLVRNMKDGESFSLDKWQKVYEEIFDKSRLSDEAYLVAGLVHFGFTLRLGDLVKCRSVLDLMTKRFEPNQDNNEGHELHRGLVRTQRRLLNDYLQFVDIAALNFRRAVAAEEFSRARLPEVALAIAELNRRSGKANEAMDWYLGLAQMAETQPKLRADIRTEGKFPSATAPYLVQVGWIADTHVAELVASGVKHPEAPNGQDKNLINAILFEGLGTAEYRSPSWKPAEGASQRDCAIVLDLSGKAVLEFNQRFGAWPKSLSETWEKDVMRDRNRVNRFHCPATGQPFLYQELAGEQPRKTVVVATSAPVPTDKGPRWGGYLADNTVVWSETVLKPGEPYLR